jgi:ABC-type Fe3+ transport system substrate-binding protein
VKRNKKIRILLWSVLAIAVLWIILTIYVQAPGNAEMFTYGNSNKGKTALIVYDPDPFYNLDEQLCKSFAEGLTQKSWQARVATVSAAEQLNTGEIDLFVICANTYNWAPDSAVKHFIANTGAIKGMPVVAITLGSGSTARASRLLEALITKRGGQLITSKQYWLMRPNDEAVTDKSNVDMAKEHVFLLGKEIGIQLGNE